jgi:glycosyltransferase involved in cell wall biosynthesis
MMAPRPDRVAPFPPTNCAIAVAGELQSPSGLGHGARLMIQALEHLGVKTYAIDTGSLMPDGRAVPVELPYGVPLVVHVNAPSMATAFLRLPRSLVRHRRVIGYWAWELPNVPANWRTGVPLVHEIWTPSHFTATALETLMPGRVRVVTHPLAIAPPAPSALQRADFGLPDHALVVLVSFNLASSLERKNPFAAISAFKAAFGDRPDRILILKVINPGHFPNDFLLLSAAAANAPNIQINTRIMTAADNYALMNAADIILSLHRSEGFGFVPAEGMLLGRPVIGTGWSGNMDFMDDNCAVLVDYRLVPPRDPRGVFRVPGAVWAEPDHASAVTALLRLADDPALRASIGAKGRATAMARLGARTLAEALYGIGIGIGIPGSIDAKVPREESPARNCSGQVA